MKSTFTIVASLLLVIAVAVPAMAEPITINYVTFVPRMHGIAKVLKTDLDTIAEKSGGRLKFVYRGGPESMKVFAQAMGVKTGAVDMCCTSPDFYGKMVKGMEVLTGSALPVVKHRESGLYEYLNSLFNPIGIQFLMVVPKEQGNMFHFFSKKPIRKVADFKGLSLAGTGVFDEIGPALGMTPVAMQMAEQYSAMEKGIIDVCRGGMDSVMAFKFFEVAKYIIKPGFGSAPASLFLNKKIWDSLGKDLQDYLVDSLYAMAPASQAKHDAIIQGATKAALKNGMEIIEVEDKDEYLKIINDAIYRNGSKDAPEIAKKIWDMSH